LLLKVIV